MFSTSFTFWFHLFRSADKIYEDATVVPPPLQRDGKGNFIPSPFYIDRFAAPPHPALLLAGAAARYSHPAFLLAGAAAHYAVTFLSAGGRGGDCYYITTSRMARAQRILVLVILMPHMENGQG